MPRIDHRGRRANGVAVLGTLLALLGAGIPARAADEPAGRIERIELAPDGSSTKVFIMLSRPLAFDVDVLDGDPARQRARRLVLDFPDATLAPAVAKPIEVASDRLQRIRTGQFDARTARIVLELASDTTHAIDAFETPPHVTIVLAATAAGGAPATPGPAAVGAPAADPTPAAAASAGVRTIPIRARGRRPYSLNYSR